MEPTIDTTQQQVYEQPQQQQADTSSEASANSVDEQGGSSFVETDQNEYDSKNQNSQQQKELNYSIFTQSLNKAGIATTHLNNGETNFAQYGAALSQEVQNMILNSYKDKPKEDKELQEKVARLFVGDGNNVWQGNTFINTLYANAEKLGIGDLEVSVSTIATTYLTDWKKNHESSYLRSDGAIDVYTIRDKSTGAEIIIADANGNGAIESEELFMNEILEGISSDFLSGEIGPAVHAVSGGSAQGGIGGAIGSIFNSVKDAISNLSGKSKKQKVNATEYNRLVDNYISKNNCTLKEAIAYVNARYHYSADDIQYSGNHKNTDNLTTTSELILQDIEAKREELEKLYEKEV